MAVACALTMACHARSASDAESRPPGTAVTPPSAPAAAPVASAVPSTGEDYAALTRGALVGRRAPDATLELLDGDRVALAGLIGKQPIYLKFWATWCKPCRAQMPHLEAAYRTYRDRIAVYAVDLGLNDPAAAVRAFKAELALTVPIALDPDGALAERFQVAVTPMHVVIDRAGVVRYVGHEANAALDAALAEVASEAEVPGDRVPPAVAAPRDEALALTLRDGSAFTLAGHAGAPVALTFVTTWCDGYLASSRPAMATACAAHARQVAALRTRYPGLTWVVVAHPVWTSTADLDDYLRRFGVAAPIGIDTHAGWFQHFKIRDVATTILLDGHGAEVARIAGDGDALADAVARL